MAEIVTAVIAHCNNNSGVFGAFSHRITPDHIPDGQVYPHARVRNVGDNQMYHMLGESGRKSVIQVDIFDDDLSGVMANTELIRSAFSGFQGQMGAIKTGQVKAHIVDGNWNEDTHTHRRILELEIPTND